MKILNTLINNCLAIFIIYNNKKFIDLDIKEYKKLICSSDFLIIKFIKFSIKLPNSKYYIGLGKLIYIKYLIKKYNLSFLLFNIILKNNQEKNLKNFFNCKILDRTDIILNIFLKRANTYYGKLQVKLAFLNYLITKLVNRWSHLERQKGGVKNISGPGEKQIEIDKRIIKKKINLIKYKLYKINKQKNKSQDLRNISNIFTVSLVGYTNSGKSTLFNLLTDSKLDVSNNYFCTLDSYIRKMKNNKNINNILISDTIGFIKNLPLNILDAFKATLNEINNSNLILHIIDISNIYFLEYVNIVNLILENILYKKIPIIQIMNKIDIIKNYNPKIDNNLNRIWISAKYNLGINLIINYINNFFLKFYNIYKICIPYKISFLLRNFLYKNNFVCKEYIKNSEMYFFVLKMTNLDFNRLLKIYPFINEYLINYE